MKIAAEMAEKLYVDVNIFHEEHKDKLAQLKGLPLSCHESAECLIQLRSFFEKDGVFSPTVIVGISKMLKAYDDKGMSEKLYGKNDQIKHLVDKYIHHM